MRFGVLRVLNDDIIAGGGGFGMHPHDNMEIITIPLEGELEHKDNMGNIGVIRKGDVQVMSAGKGVLHSEYNKNSDKEVRLFQIWLFANAKDVEPRYDQKSLLISERKNNLQLIVSPKDKSDGLWIHQEAWMYLGNFDKGISKTHSVNNPNNGVYVMVIEGSFIINGELLDKRDAIGIWSTEQINIESREDGSEILLIYLTMK
jgi:redox-sensitive bicupin YhaK (pirin superfamily)